MLCLGRRLKVGYKISTIILLLEAGEDHLCAGNVFLGVLQVNEEGILVPYDACNIETVLYGPNTYTGMRI